MFTEISKNSPTQCPPGTGTWTLQTGVLKNRVVACRSIRSYIVRCLEEVGMMYTEISKNSPTQCPPGAGSWALDAVTQTGVLKNRVVEAFLCLRSLPVRLKSVPYLVLMGPQTVPQGRVGNWSGLAIADTKVDKWLLVAWFNRRPRAYFWPLATADFFQDQDQDAGPSGRCFRTFLWIMYHSWVHVHLPVPVVDPYPDPRILYYFARFVTPGAANEACELDANTICVRRIGFACGRTATKPPFPSKGPHALFSGAQTPRLPDSHQNTVRSFSTVTTLL
ncbi:hypothetical protein C8F04DRAFT_1194642 [Mycena alexandri]|uniref:Uncharacterized protein n=1 Tax=Mycena alexandri TaxID=1745969 RepID=A0AAD6S6R4_9AGAR|nr:hypothetical protein C8F04DRAFT_1194642 [Mycena alexandri]